MLDGAGDSNSILSMNLNQWTQFAQECGIMDNKVRRMDRTC